MKKWILPAALCLFFLTTKSQDLEYARRLIDTLSSPAFDGRGYVNNGCNKAAEFLAHQFDTLGLSSFYQGTFLQPYSFPRNILSGKVEARINGKDFEPGREFLVWSASPSVNGKFRIRKIDPHWLIRPEKAEKVRKKAHGRFLLIDKKGIDDKKILAAIDSVKLSNTPGALGYISISDSKLTWSVMPGGQTANYMVADIKREALPARPRFIQMNIESSFNPSFRNHNVIGFVPGSVQPDTFLVFTAHFDHLGRMGSSVFFPGANDNASGTSMVTDLARHYAGPAHQPYYSIAFLLLSGEEAGLKGAYFCAEHSPIDLTKVKFLINLDMVGTGSEGITVVNADRYKNAFDRFVKINADNEYLLTVKSRGESCNSDHCPFYKRGVPSVFIYSMGKEFGEYHNPDDISIKLPLTEYKDIFKLVRDFMDSANTLIP